MVSFFVIAFLFASLPQVGSDLYLPSIVAISHRLNTSISWVQLSISVYILGNAAAPIIIGPLSDAIGRKKPLLIGMGLFIVGSLTCLFTNSIHLMLIGRFIQGAGGICGILIMRACLRDTLDPQQISRAASYFSIGNTAFMASAPFIGGYLQHYFGWRSNFLFLTIYSSIIFLLIAWRFPETHKSPDKSHFHPSQIFKNTKAALRNTPLMAYTLIISFCFAGFMAWITASPVILQKQLGFSPKGYGNVALTVGLAYGVGAALNGTLVKHYPPNRLIFVSLILIILTNLLMLLLGISNIVTPYTVIIPSLFCIGLTALVFPNCFAQASRYFGNNAGLTSAVMITTYILMGSTTSMIISWMDDKSFLEFAALYCGCTLIALTCYLKLISTSR